MKVMKAGVGPSDGGALLVVLIVERDRLGTSSSPPFPS